MSLVNDMLNDLDARRSNQHAGKVKLEWMKGEPVQSKSRRYLPWLGMLIVLLSFAVAWQWWHLHSRNDTAALAYLASDRAVAVKQDTASTKQTGSEASTAQAPEVVNPVGEVPATAVAVKTPPPVVSKATITTAAATTTTATSATTTTATSATTATAKDTVASVKKPPSSKAPVSTAAASTPVKTQSRPQTLQQKQLDNVASAEKLLQQQRVDEAEQLLIGFVEQNPQALRSGEKLISLWLAQQQHDKAQQLLDRLLAAYPEDIGLIKHQARLMLLNGQAEQSVLLLMSQQPPLVANSDYYELLGLAARKNQQLELSEQVYRGLLDYDASRGDWWMGLAIAIDQQAKPAARQAYQQAINSRHLSVALRDYARRRLAVL